MNKSEFLSILKNRLKAFKEAEVKEIIAFYDELIEEKKESGINEMDAINGFGTIDNIVSKVTTDLIITRSNDEKSNPMKNFWIILGICASPVLIPLGIALAAVAFSLVVVVFSLFISFAASGIGIIVGLIPMIISMIISNTELSIILLAIGICFIVVAIFGYLSLLTIHLGKKAFQKINKYFSKKIKSKTQEISDENI